MTDVAAEYEPTEDELYAGLLARQSRGEQRELGEVRQELVNAHNARVEQRRNALKVLNDCRDRVSQLRAYDATLTRWDASAHATEKSVQISANNLSALPALTAASNLAGAVLKRQHLTGEIVGVIVREMLRHAFAQDIGIESMERTQYLYDLVNGEVNWVQAELTREQVREQQLEAEYADAARDD